MKVLIKIKNWVLRFLWLLSIVMTFCGIFCQDMPTKVCGLIAFLVFIFLTIINADVIRREWHAGK